MSRTWWLGLVLLTGACGAEAHAPTARDEAVVRTAQAAWWVPDGLVLRPALQPGEAAQRFCLVTHHDAKGAAFAEVAIDSHRHYAARHGYGQKSFVGHISGNLMVDPARGGLDDLYGGGLYWQKLAAMQHVLDHGAPDVGDDATAHGVDPAPQNKPCDWVLWLDSDTVFTNEGVSLADLAYTYALDDAGAELPDVLVARDAKYPINSGVMLVRNNAEGRSFVDAVVAAYPTFRNRGLPDQDAVIAVVHDADVWLGHDTLGASTVKPRIVVAPQRAFNSFGGPGAQLAPGVQWEPCDFVAHFAGVPHGERPARMRLAVELREACAGPRATGAWTSSLGEARSLGPRPAVAGAGAPLQAGTRLR